MPTLDGRRRILSTVNGLAFVIRMQHGLARIPCARLGAELVSGDVNLAHCLLEGDFLISQL
jgi:hypothetical protein